MTVHSDQDTPPKGSSQRLGLSGCALCDEVAARLAAEEPVCPEDLAACREHERSCPRCRALAGLGPGLLEAEPPASDEEVSAVWARIRARGRRRWAWYIGAAAGLVAAALAVVVLWPRGGRRAVRGPRPRAARAISFRIAQGCARGPSGRRLCEGAPVPADSPLVADSGRVRMDAPGLTVLLVRGSSWQLSEHGREVVLVLQSGHVAVRLDPRAGLGFTVRTQWLSVEVVGTVFSVQEAGGLTVVRVARGHVRVIDRRGRLLRRLGPGERFAYGGPGGPDVSSTVAGSDPLLEELAGGTTKGQTRPASGGHGVGAPGSRVPARHRGGPVPEKGRRGPARRPGPGARPASPPRAADAGVRVSAPSSADLLLRAQECRRRGDWRCALEAYRMLAEGKGGSRVASALVAMARIELDRLGRPATALRHFEAYLKLRPNGTLAAEALYGEARALRALGRRAQERRTLEAFLARYPTSPLADRVRQRLEALRKAR